MRPVDRVIAGLPGHVDLTAEEYHSLDGVLGHSMIEQFRESRRGYRDAYIRGVLPPRQETPAMQLGTLVHLLVLEPERLDEEVVVVDVASRRVKAWKEAVEAHPGKRVLLASDLDEPRAIADAVLGHSVAGPWFRAEGRKAEHSIFWESHGLYCKARIDLLVGNIQLNLKTSPTADPDSFARQCLNLGYHRGAAWYLDGYKAAYGEPSRHPFVVVAKGTTGHEVGIYELDEDAVRLGREQNLRALEALARCLDTGDWLAPYERSPKVISLPPYAYTQEDWT